MYDQTVALKICESPASTPDRKLSTDQRSSILNDTACSTNAQSSFSRRYDSFRSLVSPSLFTYGTLLFPEVLEAIIGRVPQNQVASAAGWRVAALRNRVYPGLVEAAGEVAHGRLLTGLSDSEWRVLDGFEDPKYELRRISLTCGGAGLAYVWVDEAEACSTPWSASAFAEMHLPAYVERCAARYKRGIAAHIDAG